MLLMVRTASLSASLLLILLNAAQGQPVAPAAKERPDPLKGAIVLVGPAGMPTAAVDAFVELAGGPKAYRVLAVARCIKPEL
jgi:hypothetical protein